MVTLWGIELRVCLEMIWLPAAPLATLPKQHPGQMLSWVNLCCFLSSPLEGLYGSVIAPEINRIPWVVM